MGGVVVINDAYNANPLSMRAAIRAFRDGQREGRKWLILGDMRELGAVERDEHLAIGALVAESEWSGLIVVGPLGTLIAEGAVEAGCDRDRISQCGDASEAGHVAVTKLRSGDAVLLKASRAMHLEEVAEMLEERQEE